MKPLFEQDHYEVLEVPRDTGPDGIERAYRLILSTYGEDSLATYSMVHGADSAAIRERVETAYRVLSDAESRRSYDASLGGGKPSPELDFDETPEISMEAPRPSSEPFDDLDEAGDYDGARLRRARLRRGIDLDEIARRTKVSSNYLACLEDERFADLPPRVYVRGFVMAFAACLGLDAVSVAETYMRRYDAERPRQRRRFYRGT